MKKLLVLNLCFLSLIPLKSIAQSEIETKAISGAKLICNCTKTSLSKNSIDVVKLAEIYKSYNTNKKLLSKYNSDVQKINNKINLNYSTIESDIYACRSQFTQKYKSYLKNREFLSRIETIINNNPYTAGPKLIKTLAN
ncbi:hypothetical protein EOD40_13170 [Flavobacterium sufflavum]|uniref:DUF4168 domain-containing protein n=1 Tax=Flavobacterium sufflavum TaxID=1921138 RepID=A0A3S2UMD8_9FLAO|nr:hypothetical protein [Flavobacterium sufflavum]RVT74456.1 hypothetical protein EOD40_13170 [Flavobacterium sufflavum]